MDSEHKILGNNCHYFSGKFFRKFTLKWIYISLHTCELTAKNKQTKKHLEGNLGGKRNLAGTLNFLQITTEVKIHIRPLGTMTKLDSITASVFSSFHIYAILSTLFSKALVQKLHLSAVKALVISPLELLSMCIIKNNTTGDHDIVSSTAMRSIIL